MKNKFLPLALSIYSNYILIGICVIIINMNGATFMEQWNTNQAGLGWAVSGMGIGKLIIMLFGGVLSDKLGRKPFIFLGQMGFIGFYAGVLFSTSVTMAFAFSVLCGMSNSFIDSSGMPALMECFPGNYGSASIMVKAFVSIGQVSMPVIVNFLAAHNMWFGIAFIGCCVFMAINGLFMLTRKFPDSDCAPASKKEGSQPSAEESGDKPRLFPEGLCLSIIGFTSTATFTILLLQYPNFGQFAAGMDAASAKLLVSYFAVGSIIAVFTSAYLLAKKIMKSIHFVFGYPLIASVVLLFLYFNPTPNACVIAAYILGFTAGGGVLQLALSTMAEIFTFGKGKVTSMVYTLNNISIFVIPPIVGHLADIDVRYVILFDVFIAGLGALLAAVVMYRSHKIKASRLAAA